MHIHILGICGTFMGSLALIARELDYRVSGSDTNVYPPMSTQLAREGIRVQEGYDPGHLEAEAPDMVVIGNALSRGNPAIEHVLNRGMEYCSGPEWLARHVLPGRWVLAVAGTHGKTSTSAMLAWILEYAGMAPGYLIGGVLQNFPLSARLGETPFFVVEADEYDSAFFDKRSKFVHYHPRTLVLNNLEYDHADIFPDLAAIQRQFNHLLRTVPSEGLVVLPCGEANLDAVLEQGCWTPVERFDLTRDVADPDGASGAVAKLESTDGSRFRFRLSASEGNQEPEHEVRWNQSGSHNVRNALAAILAARHVGVAPAVAAEALAQFRGVKRRMECLGEVDGVTVYDDFAHHPTAIALTLEAARARLSGDGRLIAVIEPRSNTMKMGVHRDVLAAACQAADLSVWLRPGDDAASLDLEAALLQGGDDKVRVLPSSEAILQLLQQQCLAGDMVIIMSNGGFDGIHQRLLQALGEREK